jgi:CBS domain-containing protein
MKVASILKRKGTDVVTVTPETTIVRAAAELHAKGIGALMVSADGRTMLGMLSERDVVNGIAVYGARALELRVSDLMTRKPVTCMPEDSVTRLMAQMTEHRVRHLPVMDGQELRGIVSIGDAVKHRLEELETEANILREAFIARH